MRMPVPWKVLGSTVGTGGACTILSFFFFTRDIEFVPLESSDPIFLSEHFKRYNPYGNPTIHDLHIKRVPLSQIDPKLREDQDKLLERYCGGVWAGLGGCRTSSSSYCNHSIRQSDKNMLSYAITTGFAPQRILLALLYKETSRTDPAAPGPAPLWSPSELLESEYKPGTDIAGHFGVIERSKQGHSILIRGGDKISNRGLRPLDGFIELTASVDQQHSLVEFGFKTVFFQGLGPAAGGKLPMPGPVVWLHEQYARALLASGVSHVCM
ncbi:hypothetical protein BDV09DRAFT_195985 [Aspergillus tetrazonus]